MISNYPSLLEFPIFVLSLYETKVYGFPACFVAKIFARKKKILWTTFRNPVNRLLIQIQSKPKRFIKLNLSQNTIEWCQYLVKVKVILPLICWVLVVVNITIVEIVRQPFFFFQKGDSENSLTAAANHNFFITERKSYFIRHAKT